MRCLFTSLAVVALAAFVGCSQGTPGGPGTAGEKPSYGQADNTFNLSVPLMPSSLQQGESTEATIGITRAKNFDQDVALGFANLPEGVTIDPSAPVIKSGERDTKITLTAEDETPLGGFMVQVTGHPAEGSDAQIEFGLVIAPKDGFTLSMPRSTTLKQGETETVSIGISRDKKFDRDISLEFGPMPAGVSVEPNAPVIKHGKATAQVTLTATGDASLGNFTIEVTGHPARGADAPNEFQLIVVTTENR